MELFMKDFLHTLSSIFDNSSSDVPESIIVDDLSTTLFTLPWTISKTKDIDEPTSEETLCGKRESQDLEKEKTNGDQELHHGRNAFHVVAHDNDSNCNWNIRDDDEEKDNVYHMPSDTYRSYEPYYWKNGAAGEDVGNDQVDESKQKSETSAPKEEHSEKTISAGRTSADLTTPQTKANICHAPGDKIESRFLCRVCRIFQDAGRDKTSEKKRTWLEKKLLFWRRKPRHIPCANCGCGIDRRSFVDRIFAVGRKSGETH